MGGFDVAVIGAGVHGASAAYHLASSGARTVVFDRGAPGGGPTGRSSAVCRAYYTNDFLAACARDSIRMMADFEHLVGGDSGYRRTGALFLHPPEDQADVLASVARLNQLGIRTAALRPEEILERFPHFDLSGVGVGAWEEDAGYADPAGTTLGLFERAVAFGAEPRLRTSVQRVELRAGGGATLVTSTGERIGADRALIAAGPWTRPLAAGAGVDLPLTVERHVVATFRWAGARPAPLHADVAGGYYLKPEGDELYLVGPLHAAPNVDPDAFNERITAEEVADLSGRVVRRVPQLERSESQGGWASLYDVSPDWQPVIGEIAPGVFVDAGTSGHGFKLAPALGRHVAALVLGDAPGPGINDFHPRRFAEHRALASGWGDARILG
jgi:glycine/D-amino acid oxidase-like deaminating enzyme